MTAAEGAAVELLGHTVRDNTGARIGSVGPVYLSDQTGRPTWITVIDGVVRTVGHLAPLHAAVPTADGMRLAISKDLIETAPTATILDGHLDMQSQAALTTHYAAALASAAAHRAGTEPPAGRTGRYGAPDDPSGDTPGALSRNGELSHNRFGVPTPGASALVHPTESTNSSG